MDGTLRCANSPPDGLNEVHRGSSHVTPSQQRTSEASEPSARADQSLALSGTTLAEIYPRVHRGVPDGPVRIYGTLMARAQ